MLIYFYLQFFKGFTLSLRSLRLNMWGADQIMGNLDLLRLGSADPLTLKKHATFVISMIKTNQM